MKHFFNRLLAALICALTLSGVAYAQAPEKLYVIGYPWDTAMDTPIATLLPVKAKVDGQEKNVYQGIIPAAKASRSFRFYTDLNWNSSYSIGPTGAQLVEGQNYYETKEYDWRDSLSINLTQGEGGQGAIRFTNWGDINSTSGNKDLLVSVSLEDMKVTFYEAKVYIIGGSIGWGERDKETPDPSLQFTRQSDGWHKITLPYDKVKCASDGNGFRLHVYPTGGQYGLTLGPGSEDKSIDCTLADYGDYTGSAAFQSGDCNKFAFKSVPENNSVPKNEIELAVNLATNEFRVSDTRNPEKLYVIGDNWKMEAPMATLLPVQAKVNGMTKSVYQGIIPASKANKNFRFYTQQNNDWPISTSIGASGVANGKTQDYVWEEGKSINLTRGGEGAIRFNNWGDYDNGTGDKDLLVSVSLEDNTVTFYEAKVCLIGGSNGWNRDNPPFTFTRQSDGWHKITLPYDKVKCASDGNGFRLHVYPTGGQYGLTLGPGSEDKSIDCTLADYGDYTGSAAFQSGDCNKFAFKSVPQNDIELAVNLQTNEFKVSDTKIPTSLWMLGCQVGWNWDNAIEFTQTGENTRIYTYTFADNSETLNAKNDAGCRFYINKSWDNPVNFCPSLTDINTDVLFNGNRKTSCKIVKGSGDTGKFNFFDIPEGKTVKVTVDLNQMLLTAELLDVAPNYEHYYLVGEIDRDGSWGDLNKAYEFVKGNDGKYRVNNAAIGLGIGGTDGYNTDENGKKVYPHFQILTQRQWGCDRVLAVNAVDETTLMGAKTGNYSTPAQVVLGTEKEPAGANFQATRGIYNVIFDPATMKVSLEKVEGDYYEKNVDMRMAFWEGPINKILGGGNASAKDIPFKFVRVNDEGNFVYKIDVSGNNEAIEYVSQMYIGGHAVINKWVWEDGILQDKGAVVSTDKAGEGRGTYHTLYFDAHSTGKLIPLFTDFWCDNSRMEVGLKVQGIYLVLYPGMMNNVAADEVPARILLSETPDAVIAGAKEQIPLNSDRYSIKLYQGDLYNKLHGTLNGVIEIPFARHAAGDEKYVINLGSYITLSADEQFEFTVTPSDPSKPAYTKSFVINAVNQYAEGTDGRYTTLAKDMKFNQIILSVEGDNYNVHKLWVRDSSQAGHTPADYNKHMRNPMLKVWPNNAGEWTGLYNNSEIQPTLQDGMAKYYEFTPVEKNLGIDGVDKRTNLYYLDLDNNGQGVKVRKGVYKKETANFGGVDKEWEFYDQFNIVDQNGYDVSNPFQGSQMIYPGTWWCANPGLMVNKAGEGTRQYQGHHFSAVPEFPSRVDLAWNLPDGQEEVTIYGITLFKIVGNVYDIYAEAEREKSLYYVFAHTERRTGTTLREKCEQTAPLLLLAGKDTPMRQSTVTREAGTDLQEYQPVNRGELSYNTPDFGGKKAYVLTLSSQGIEGNTDLNYTLSDLNIQLKDPSELEIVSVTGKQRWASSEGDKLRANLWTNYYTGSDDSQKTLTVNNIAPKYTKVVLATNPDQVRYQIMALAADVQPKTSYDYAKGSEAAKDKSLIYPITDVTTTLIWQNGYKMNVELLDKNGNAITDPNGQPIVVEINAKPEGSALEDGNGFYDEGEGPFQVSLGKFFTQPGVEFKVKVTYVPADSSKGQQDVTSNTAATSELPKPMLENLTAVAEQTEDQNGNYTSDLSWESDAYDFPHLYDFYAYPKGGEKPTDQNKAVEGGDKYVSTDSNSIENVDGKGTPFKDLPEDSNDHKTATMNYSGTSKFNYAVPKSPFRRVEDNWTANYTAVPEQFEKQIVTSDEATTTADFGYNVPTGVEVIEDAAEGPAEYYNLQGVRVQNPANGIYIRVQGGKSQKVMIR